MSIIITTPNISNYVAIPVMGKQINMGIQASKEAKIILRKDLADDLYMYEITIGAWENTKTIIKRCGNVEAITVTHEILNADEMCDFKILWSCDGLLKITKKLDYDNPFLIYKDRQPFIINFIEVSTVWGVTGKWIVEGYQFSSPVIRQQLLDTCHFWTDFNEAFGLPQNAVMASEDGLYIGRAHHLNTVLLGGIRDNVCTISWAGATHEKREFQVLCCKNVNWVKSWHGYVPLHALPAGENEFGHILFIGRMLHEGIYYIGKIEPYEHICSVAVNGQEMSFLEYEALVIYEDDDYLR